MSSTQDYVTQRIDEQASWHEQKANQYKQRYHILQIVIIVASSIIPIINIVDFAPLSVRVLSAILGSLIARYCRNSSAKKISRGLVALPINRNGFKEREISVRIFGRGVFWTNR